MWSLQNCSGVTCDRVKKVSFNFGVIHKPTCTLDLNFISHKSQGLASSCTCFSIVIAITYIMKRCKSLKSNQSLSERFLYYISRQGIGIEDQDKGIDIGYSLKAAYEYGIATENICPYYP